MREILKRTKTKLSLFIIFLLLFILSGCEGFNFNDINFGGDLRTQLKEDLKVTYTFYEYADINSMHEERIFQTGKTVSESSFPKYEHEDTLLVGWNYLRNTTTGNTTMPSNFSLNRKGYIGSVKPGNSPESLYAVWKKKCTITFVSNWPGIDIPQQILPEGDTIEQPRFEYRQGNFRFWGWYTDAELTTFWSYDTPVTGDVTLYGRWQEVRTIKYYKNDGSNEYREMEYGVDWTNRIDGCMFRRSGYGFLGWSTNPAADVNGITHQQGDEFDPLTDIPNNLTLYAIWTTDIVTITYIDSTGIFANKTETYGRGARAQVSYVLNDQGYWLNWLGNMWQQEGLNIAGFSTSSTRPATFEYNSNGSYQVIDPNTGLPMQDEYGVGVWSNYITIQDNLTLYVYWQGISFYLQYYYLNDSGSEVYFTEQTVEWNECATPPSTEPTVTGKVFDGWYIADYVWNPVTQTSDFVVSNTLFDFNTRFNRSSFPNNTWVYLCAKFFDAGHAGTGTVSFTQVGESDITVGVDETIGPNQIRFTAPLYSGEDAYYHWYLNDIQTGETLNYITFNYSDWAPGIYDVLLICSDGTHEYSFQGKIQKNQGRGKNESINEI